MSAGSAGHVGSCKGCAPGKDVAVRHHPGTKRSDGKIDGERGHGVETVREVGRRRR